jgi:hypothetical protein
MKILPDLSKKQKLELELDIRLASIWNLTDDFEEWDLEKVAQFMRASYAQGYVHALTEEEGGTLLDDAPGYRITGRKR